MNDNLVVTEIIKNIDLFLNKRISIVAGHYCVASDLSDLSNEGTSELFSFKLGIRTHKILKEKNISSKLVLWINDIGIDQIQRQQLKENYKIPDNYSEILMNEGISPSEILIIFESTSRNQASVLFRKVYKKTPSKFKIFSSNDKSLVRCIDNDNCTIEEDKKVYAIEDPKGNPIVMKEGTNPKCNLILGSLFRSIINTNSSDIVINIFNDIYIDRIRLGIFVGTQVYDLKVKFVNFFCDEDSVFEEEFK
jgi:hypothetical protein